MRYPNTDGHIYYSFPSIDFHSYYDCGKAETQTLQRSFSFSKLQTVNYNLKNN